MDDWDTAQRILESTRTVAIVGASARPQRESHRAMQYLLRNGFAVVPVNPNLQQIAGQICYPDLAEVPTSVDTVVCFRRSEYIDSVAREAIAARARHLWMQLGVVNAPAAELARAAGLLTVMNRCIMIDHRRWQAMSASR